MPPDFFFPSRRHRLSGACMRFSRRQWRRQPRQQLPAGDGPAEAGRHPRTGAIRDANRSPIRSPQQFPKEQTGKSVNVNAVARRGRPAGRGMMLLGAGRRVDLRAADRVHQPREPADVARARRAADGVRGARRGRRERRSTRPADADRQPAAGRRAAARSACVLAIAAAPLVVRLVPTALPIAEVPPIDFRMLRSRRSITIGTGLAFGVLPALRMSRQGRRHRH